MALLKELIDKGLIAPSLISVEKNDQGTYDLILKGNCDAKELKEAVAEKDLLIEEQKDGHFIIHKP